MAAPELRPVDAHQLNWFLPSTVELSTRQRRHCIYYSLISVGHHFYYGEEDLLEK